MVCAGKNRWRRGYDGFIVGELFIVGCMAFMWHRSAWCGGEGWS